MKKVLITDGVHPLLIEGLKKHGYQVDYDPAIPLEQVREIVGEYRGMIINSKILVDREMLDKGRQLEFIGRLGSGLEIIDLDYAQVKGVRILNSPEGNCNAVGEHALGMLLALANNLVRSDREVRRMIWEREKNRGFELRGRTIGLIGFGHTGRAFAQKLRGMEMRILAYDKYKTGFQQQFPYVEEVELAQIKKEAEIISLHLPLTEETTGWINSAFLKTCQKGLILINTSRGTIIPTLDLIHLLEKGHLRGACLDVFENEKPTTFSAEERTQYEQLYSFENVILSPHIAGWTKESKELLASILLRKIVEN
jgi:D-3-phosphoglycerate dehydrogenase